MAVHKLRDYPVGVHMKTATRVVTIAVVIDVIAVVAFAVAGRLHHGEGADIAGVASTAWPFLVGLAAGWVTVLKAYENVHPMHIFPAGVTLWAWTMIGGVIIRILTEAGTAISFVLTATIVTGVLLVGWRALAQLAMRLRRTPTPSDSGSVS